MTVLNAARTANPSTKGLEVVLFVVLELAILEMKNATKRPHRSLIDISGKCCRSNAAGVIGITRCLSILPLVQVSDDSRPIQRKLPS